MSSSGSGMFIFWLGRRGSLDPDLSESEDVSLFDVRVMVWGETEGEEQSRGGRRGGDGTSSKEEDILCFLALAWMGVERGLSGGEMSDKSPSLLDSL